MDELDVWLDHGPIFNWGYHTDIFGSHHLVYPHWDGLGDRWMSGRMLRKFGGEIAEDVWEALKFSYCFDQTQDLYEPVRLYYEAAYDYYMFHRPGATNRICWDKTDINDKCEFVKRRAADKYASQMVEKEGQRWWEWKLVYNVDMILGEIAP